MPEATPLPDAPAPARHEVRVWDIPTRLVHWLMVSSVAVSWWTGETGRLEWHRWSGYLLLGLVIFRLYWGFFGGSTARFARFVRGPRTIAGYLRGSWEAAAGHNPLGALSVLALILGMLVQVALGLFAVDVDGIESGPLSLYVSFEAGRTAAEWHDSTFKVLMSLIVLHIVAIGWYRIARREKLLGAMIHGRRAYPLPLPPVQPALLRHLIIGIVLAAGLTWAVSRAFEF